MKLLFQLSSETSIEVSANVNLNIDLHSFKWQFTEEGELYPYVREIGKYNVFKITCKDEALQGVYVDRDTRSMRVFQALKNLGDNAYLHIQKVNDNACDFWIIRKTDDKFIVSQRFHEIWKHEINLIVDKTLSS